MVTKNVDRKILRKLRTCGLGLSQVALALLGPNQSDGVGAEKGAKNRGEKNVKKRKRKRKSKSPPKYDLILPYATCSGNSHYGDRFEATCAKFAAWKLGADVVMLFDVS